MKASKVRFNADALQKKILKGLIQEQTDRLIEYAKTAAQDLAAKIQSFGYRNNFDDYGNLLDSICWGVCYDGQLKDSGFYREKRATMATTMHGYSKVALREGNTRRKWKDLYGQNKQWMLDASWSYTSAGEPINGRALAEEYLAKCHKNCKSGQWTMFIAILAPYWGYWEKGHKNIFLGEIGGLHVMTSFYDQFRRDLKPSRVRIHVTVPKYASKSLHAQAKKNLKQGNR